MATSLSKRASGTLAKQSKPLTIGALELALLKEFPSTDAEEWDRMGLLVGDPASLVEGVAIALDPTTRAIEEAANCGANVLVTHHPAYLDAPERFRPSSLGSGSVVWSAISNKVALINVHTALDVSLPAQQVLPGMLNLSFTGKLLEPCVDQKKGYGQICSVKDTDKPLSLEQLAARCTSVFARPPRVWGDYSQQLTKVVTWTGSAGKIAQKCVLEHIDCLVCGEIKYHEALDLAAAGVSVVELGHDTSELPLTAVLGDAVQRLGVSQEKITLLDQGKNWSYPEATRM